MKYLIFLITIISFVFVSGCQQTALNINPTDEHGSLISVGISHAQIHAGKSWFNSDQVTLANGASREILLIPECPLDVHLDIQMRSTGEANFFLYENIIVSNNGTFIQPRNRNREFADNNSMNLYLNPTRTGGDLLILDQKHFGSGQQTIGESRGFNEIILNCNETYLIDITSEAASNDISYVIDWYENTE